MSWQEFFNKNKKEFGLNVLEYFNQNYEMYKILYNETKGLTFFGLGSGRGIHEYCMSTIKSDKIIISDIDLEIIKTLEKQFEDTFSILRVDMCKFPFDGEHQATFSDGVLEHLTDEQLEDFFKNQIKQKVKVITFSVPTNYASKEFGDENLRTYDEWLRIINKYCEGKKVKCFPLGYSNKILWAYRRIFNLTKYPPRKFELNQASTLLFIIK